MRYARPRLLTSDDPRYRAHVASFLVQRQNQRATRPPRQRDLFGGQAEAALRDWLGTHYTLAATRMLEYEERRNRRATLKYREIDAVYVADRQTIHIFEIKASRTASSVRRAAAQLRETRAILHGLYPTVCPCMLLVDTGIPTADEVAALIAGPDAPARPPATLADVLTAHDDLGLAASLDARTADGSLIDVLCFTVDDIIALVGAENLALDWEADEAPEEPLPRPVASLVATSEEPPADNTPDDDRDNPLAAALRRAGLS